MESREFVADPEQPDEGLAGWIHRPPDIPLQAPTRVDVPYPLPLFHGSLMPGDPSTSIDLQSGPQPTSLVPFQFNQTLADPMEDAHAHDAYWTEDVQRQIAELQLRHEVARYQILENAQAIPAISHVQEAPASYPYAAMGEPAAGYAGVYDTANVPVGLAQIPNHDFNLDDNSSTYGVDTGLWPAHQLMQTTVYPGSTRDHVGGYDQQYNTFQNARDLDYNALKHSTYGQQPSHNPMALTVSYCNTMPSASSPYHQGNHPSLFMAPAQPSFSQQILPLRNFGVAPVAPSQLPTSATRNIVCDATSSMPLWNGNTELSADHSSTVVVHELPFYPTINHSAVSDVKMTGTIGPQVPTGAIRRQAGRGKWRQSISTSPYDTATRPGCAVDNIQFHTSPEADRHRQSSQPRIYSKRSKKVQRSCFGCRLSKKSCEDTAHGVCLRCQNILKMYSDRTVLPRFTCNVRTKLFEIPIFTDVPAAKLSELEISTKLLSTLSHPLEVAGGDGFPPITIGHSKRACLRDTAIVVERLLGRVRDLLDILEPLHPRQMFPSLSHSMIRLSYSFSLIRWRSAICFFMPDLEDVLNFHEHYHRYTLREYLWELDWVISSGEYNVAAILLSTLHEGISVIRNTSTVNKSAKGHLLSSLRYYVLHLYRHQFPKSPELDAFLRYEPLARGAWLWGLSSQTSGLLPASYPSDIHGRFCYGISLMQKELSSLDCFRMLAATMMATFTTTTATATGTFRYDRAYRNTIDRASQLLQSSTLEAYFPARVLTIFGMSTEKTNFLEGVIRKRLDEVDPIFAKDMHNMSPWSLAIGLQVFFDRTDIGEHTKKSKESILTHIMLSSLSVWDVYLDFHRRSGAPGEYPDIRNITITDRFTLEALMMDWYARDLARYDQEKRPWEIEETLNKAAGGKVCDM